MSEWSAGVGGRGSGVGVGFDIPNPEPRTPKPEAERGGVAGPGPKPIQFHGTDAVRRAVSGGDLEALWRVWDVELNRFRAKREAFLLYE